MAGFVLSMGSIAGCDVVSSVVVSSVVVSSAVVSSVASVVVAVSPTSVPRRARHFFSLHQSRGGPVSSFFFDISPEAGPTCSTPVFFAFAALMMRQPLPFRFNWRQFYLYVVSLAPKKNGVSQITNTKYSHIMSYARMCAACVRNMHAS